jgi:2-keto-3-deoxy-L-rhamnonate aldolase RhmA
MADEEMTDGPWESPVKRRLRESQPVFGCTITTTSLDVAARAASAGFHFLWLEMEHSPLTLETARNIVLATHNLPAVPFARVPVTEIWMAKRVLDAGVHGVIFPFVSTPALARQAAHACRYPPTGGRGSGASLATSCWPESEGYHDSADRNIVVVAIIEQAEALDHVDEIAATPGVDVIFVGTGDLSFSLGLRGQQTHEKVEHAAEQVLAAARRHDKAAGRPAGSIEDTRRYIEQGFLFFQAPSDLALFESGARQFLGPHGITHARRQRANY